MSSTTPAAPKTDASGGISYRPLRGKVYAPSDWTAPSSVKAPPPASLSLEYVHGYRGRDGRSNVVVNASGHLVYYTAGVGIVMHPTSRAQQTFVQHTDDITCITMEPAEKTLVATGQMGKAPFTIIWDSANVTEVTRLEGFHERAVISAAWSKTDSNIIATMGSDNSHSIAIWDISKGVALTQMKTSMDRMFSLISDPSSPDGSIGWTAIGVKYVRKYTLNPAAAPTRGGVTTKGASLTAGRKGLFGKSGKSQAVLACIWSPDGARMITGNADGSIYEWVDGSVSSVHAEAHEGSVFTLFGDESGFISGGKDGKIIEWSWDVAAGRVIDAPDGSAVRSVFRVNGVVYAGTAGGYVYSWAEGADPAATTLMTSPGTSETWALASASAGTAAGDYFATGSDDGRVVVYSTVEHSSVGSLTVPQGVRCAAWSPSGNQLAVGMKGGLWAVLDCNAGALERAVSNAEHEGDSVPDLKWSPDGNVLAVGFGEGVIVLYDAANGFAQTAVLKGLSAGVTHLDFSEDGAVLQATSVGYELLYWDVATGKQVKTPSSLADTQWATFTCTLGWPVMGIWSDTGDGTDINAVDTAHGKSLVAAGDDFGKVRLYRFPTGVLKAPSRRYGGHSAHVTNVRWSGDDAHLLSVGGADASVFQWRVVPKV